jgi:hypothetical protein
MLNVCVEHGCIQLSSSSRHAQAQKLEHGTRVSAARSTSIHADAEDNDGMPPNLVPTGLPVFGGGW